MTAGSHFSVDSTRIINPKHRLFTPSGATVAKAKSRLDSHSAANPTTKR